MTEKTIADVIFTQRATQAAIWAMPALGLEGIRIAMANDLGAQAGDIVYFSRPVEWKHAILTPNSQVPYVLSHLTTAQGPMVVEVPPADDNTFLFGTFVNAWDVPICDVGPDGHDQGKGGKYLFLPPEYKGKIPRGYQVFHTDSYAVYFAFRPVSRGGGTWRQAMAYAQQLKIYPLEFAQTPPNPRFIDVSNSEFDSLTPFNASLFERLASFIQTEYAHEKDKAMFGLLAAIGIEKEREFLPDEDERIAYDEAAQLAFDYLQDYFTRPGGALKTIWPDSHWKLPNISPEHAIAGFTFETQDRLFIDERAGGVYFYAIFLPKKLGTGALYLISQHDDQGNPLNGQATYHLNIPADVPVRDFWSIQLYGMKSKSFIQQVSKPGISSLAQDGLAQNDDGSYDLIFAPEKSGVFAPNHVPTGEDFFVILRLYGPNQPIAETTWRPGEISNQKLQNPDQEREHS